MISDLKRDYNISDSELCMFTSNLVQTMTRDSAEFLLRGVSATDITDLETLGNDFEVFPTDSYYQADVALAVDNKNNTREGLEVEVRDVIQCAIIKWGEGSPQYKKFGAAKITSAGDMKFLTMCRQVVTVATEYLTELSSVGLTQTMIDAVDNDSQEFEDNMNTIRNAVETRDIKTNERVTNGNELYSYVVKYCKIGKIIWDDVDKAKYNDYIIYPTEHPGLSKPQNFTADWDAGTPEVITLNWDAVTGATNYDIFYDIAETGAPSGDFELLNNFPAPPVLVPSTYNKRNYFKIKAKNETQTSPYSNEAFEDVPEEPTG